MRILIIDDSRAMRLILRRALRRAGYGRASVDEAANGDEAIEAITARPPDLVLTDWHMPGLSGLELVGRIRELTTSAHIGMITSQGTPVSTVQAMEAGADFLLTKPLTTRQLSAVLDEVFPKAWARGRIGRAIRGR